MLNWPGDRIGVVGGPGDRRDEDFVTLGQLSAEMFNTIIIKEDDDTRGRPRGDAADWIERGILDRNPQQPYQLILDEAEAIQTALDQATEGSLVVILPESVSRAIAIIKERSPKPANLSDRPTPLNPPLESETEEVSVSSRLNS